MMNWRQLITTKRLGLEQYHSEHADVRSQFERDYDRLIFSAPFRRLQNKTQVFPLPGSIFVHNRLTHSLEVSTVGRSLGSIVAHSLAKHYPQDADKLMEIPSIVQAACLAHDMGNPPFGHSGETAIGTYFSEGKGKELRPFFTSDQWADFTHFEGNANAFRLLAHRYVGRREGGFVLTYSTLASIIKYPYESKYSPKGKQKFGFFQQDKSLYERIAADMGIVRQVGRPEVYARHPLVYLVEAADDICYELMDLEDACKLHIVSVDKAIELYMAFLDDQNKVKKQEHLSRVEDPNEKLAYLRSVVIGILVDACAEAFIEHEPQILAGELQPSLIDMLPERLMHAYQQCASLSKKEIYRSKMVLDIELSGYKVISVLLEHYIEAAFHPETVYSQQLINRVPSQYDVRSEDLYSRVMGILDFLSGMTDVYALDLYRMIQGIEIPKL
ncbi:MAG: deoxyguanosinetriphosphate triphosphohydrolase [Paludibacteraceae bacterium]|nr:deoxyguanosinetriphosphate triphosphohydrolase [Paludibacteraceae bacterium]